MSSQCPYMFMSVKGSPYLVELHSWEFGCIFPISSYLSQEVVVATVGDLGGLVEVERVSLAVLTDVPGVEGLCTWPRK